MNKAVNQPAPDKNTPAVTMGDLNVNPDPDKAGATPVTPTEKVSVGGKELTVTPDVAEALRALEANGGNTDALTRQVQELSNQLKALTTPKKGAEGEELGLDVLLFSDPQKAIAQIEEKILAKVEGKVAQTNAQRELWDEFYRQNNDLKDYDGYVRFVFSRDYAQMVKDGLTVGQTIDRVAKAVKADLLKMRGGDKGKGGGKVAEGSEGKGTPAKDAAPSDDESEQPLSTADILKARRDARRSAQKPGKKS